MRITFIIPGLSHNGGTRVVAAYAEHLVRRGHHVTVLAAPCRRRTMRKQIKRWLNITRPNSPRGPAPFFDHLNEAIHLVTFNRPLGPGDIPEADLVIATWWETAPMVMKLPASKGRKVYFIQGDERFAAANPQDVVATWQYPMHRIAISQWLVDVVTPHLDRGSVDLVHNAVDPKQFGAPPRNKQSHPTVGVVLSEAHIKGSDIAAQAVKRAQQRLPELRLKAFGYARRIELFDLPPATTYAWNPSQQKIVETYAFVDAWLFPSRYEGFGLPILEAMACRTPVIATPAGAAPELLALGGGVLLDDHDPRRMAEAIEKISAASEHDWKQMSEAAYRTALQHTWDYATDAFEAALSRALKPPKHAEPAAFSY